MKNSDRNTDTRYKTYIPRRKKRKEEREIETKESTRILSVCHRKNGRKDKESARANLKGRTQKRRRLPKEDNYYVLYFVILSILKNEYEYISSQRSNLS